MPCHAILYSLEDLLSHSIGALVNKQAQVADIGLMGAPAKKANAEGVMKAVPGVNIFVGGAIGEDARLQEEPSYKGIPLTEEDLLPVMKEILITKFNATLK